MMEIIKKVELSMYQNVQKRTLSAINHWRTIDQVLHFEKVSFVKIEKIPDKVSVNRAILFGVLANSRGKRVFFHCFLLIRQIFWGNKKDRNPGLLNNKLI